MIIDDVHRMAFIHIPKCAGTSVRKQLAPVDSTGGAFYPVMDHPALGRIHLSHIPLAFLREHYPAEFDKVSAYQAFALIREPMARFASAAFQHLKGFRRLPPGEITPIMAVQEGLRVMEWLEGREAFCDFEYIHFARQRDYVRLGGTQVVGNLFAIEDLGGFADSVEKVCGVRLDPAHRENTNFASFSPLTRGVRRVLRPIYRKLTRWEDRQKLLLQIKKANAGRDEPLYAAFRGDRRIRDFVRRYYAEDEDIYARLRRGKDAAALPALAMAAS